MKRGRKGEREEGSLGCVAVCNAAGGSAANLAQKPPPGRRGCLPACRAPLLLPPPSPTRARSRAAGGWFLVEALQASAGGRRACRPGRAAESARTSRCGRRPARFPPLPLSMPAGGTGTTRRWHHDMRRPAPRPAPAPATRNSPTTRRYTLPRQFQCQALPLPLCQRRQEGRRRASPAAPGLATPILGRALQGWPAAGWRAAEIEQV